MHMSKDYVRRDNDNIQFENEILNRNQNNNSQLDDIEKASKVKKEQISSFFNRRPQTVLMDGPLNKNQKSQIDFQKNSNNNPTQNHSQLIDQSVVINSSMSINNNALASQIESYMTNQPVLNEMSKTKQYDTSLFIRKEIDKLNEKLDYREFEKYNASKGLKESKS